MKRKTFWLLWIASAILLSLPALASSVDILHGKTRAELQPENGQFSVERQALNPTNATRYYDWLGDVASESSVAPNNVAVRQHYLKQLETIPGKIDSSFPLREQALQAFKLRNTAKVEARAMMTDRKAAALLDKTDPIPTLQDVVRKVYDCGRGPVGDDMWRKILKSSTRSRSSINQSLGIGN